MLSSIWLMEAALRISSKVSSSGIKPILFLIVDENRKLSWGIYLCYPKPFQ